MAKMRITYNIPMVMMMIMMISPKKKKKNIMEFERQKEKKSNQIQYSNQEKKLKNLDRKFEVIESLAPPTPPPPYQKKVKMNETVIRSLLFWLVFFPISNTQI